MNILITGSKGQLGQEIKAISGIFDYNFLFTDIDELNITSENEIETFCIDNKIDTIINCAAYTAVDKAEEEEEKAFLVNTTAVKYLAETCKKLNIFMVHISTDYVYEGSSTPYVETYPTSPQGVYAQTKLDGEKEIEKSGCNAICLRTSWLYSRFGGNFVATMIRLGNEKDELGVIFDQIGTPTNAADLAKAILDILPKAIEKQGYHLYNYSNEGVCSWYDFALSIMKIKSIDCKIKPIETFQYPTPAKRPAFSVLNKRKIKEEYGIEIPHWEASLTKCLKQL